MGSMINDNGTVVQQRNSTSGALSDAEHHNPRDRAIDGPRSERHKPLNNSDDGTNDGDDDDDDSSIYHDSEQSEEILVCGSNPTRIAHQSSAIPNILHQLNQKAAANALPQNIQRLLKRWRDQHGDVGPMCATRINRLELRYLHHDRASGEPVTWLHVSGEILQVTTYLVPESLNAQRTRNKGEWRYVVVRGSALYPSIVRFYRWGYLDPF